MRSAGGTGPAIFRTPSGELSPDVELRRDGCDMIKAAYLFLELLECPSQARDYVLALMGISRGDSKSILTIPGYILINHTGWSVATTKRKRQKFKDWVKETKLNLIEIFERDYDSASGKYLSTQYRVVISDYVAMFVTLARERGCSDFSGSGKYSVERAIESGLQEVAEDVAKDIETARLTQRTRLNRRGGARPSAGQMPLTARREQEVERIKAALFNWTHQTLDLNCLLEVEVIALQEAMQETLNAALAAWEQGQVALKEKRRQSPSIKVILGDMLEF